MAKFVISKLAANWNKKVGATLAQIRSNLRSEIPDEYIRFLQWSNGGEGFVGAKYLALWNVDEIARLNQDYKINVYTPDLLAVGTDGGGVAYAFDFRHRPPSFVSIPLGDLDYASVITLDQSFSGWITTITS